MVTRMKTITRHALIFVILLNTCLPLVARGACVRQPFPPEDSQSLKFDFECQDDLEKAFHAQPVRMFDEQYSSLKSTAYERQAVPLLCDLLHQLVRLQI